MSRIIDKACNNLIGGNLRRLRLEKKLSQKDVADRLETMAVYVCRGSVSRIENGERTVTDIEIDGLCRVLHVSLNQLFYGRE